MLLQHLDMVSYISLLAPLGFTCYGLVARGLISEVLILIADVCWRDFGFNLCVTPFLNVYIPNFKLEDES